MDAGHLQSKQPRSVLSGSYGHPVHPILVTLPIGAWVCSFIFDLGRPEVDVLEGLTTAIMARKTSSNCFMRAI